MSLQDLQNNAIGILSNMPARTPEQVRLVLRTVLPLYPDLSATIKETQIYSLMLPTPGSPQTLWVGRP